MDKRKKSLFIITCMIMFAIAFFLPITVGASDEQNRYCEGCQQNIAKAEWVAIGGEQTQTLTMAEGTHYYLSADITGTPDGGVLINGSGCVDLNGFNITAGSECIAISCDAGTINLMGNGTVLGTYTTASYGATIHTANAAVVNLYGGTYTKTGNNSAIYVGTKCKVYMHDGATINATGTYETYPTAVFLEQKSGLFHMYGGSIVGGTTTGNGGSIRVTNSSKCIIDGGTISGGKASRGGNIAVRESGSLTVNGGTITSGTATQSYGGGNIFTNKCTVTINGGLITLGTAADSSYGGGNISNFKGTLNIKGGTISYGSTSNESCRGGGNIYIEGSSDGVNNAKTNISGGTITDSQTTGSGGNIYQKYGVTAISGGTISGGKTTGTSDQSEGGGNIYILDGEMSMTDGTISGGTISVGNGGNILDSGVVVIDGGEITGGQGYRGGNIAVREGGDLTVNGGTITSGTATQSYGGGNIYTNKCTVTINGGLITLGTAGGSSYGGGNIGNYKGTVNINGGTVSYGRAVNESCRGGGNIYMEGDNAILNFTAGTVTAGYIATGNGHSIYARSGSLSFGSGSTVGAEAEGTDGEMNVYLHSGDLESAGSFTGGVYVNAGNASLVGGRYDTFDYNGSETCTITGGRFRVNYSEYVPEGYCWVSTVASDEYIYTVLQEDEVPNVTLVDKDGKEAYTFDALTQFDPDLFAYIKLHGDMDLGTMTDQELWIDLNGKNLIVAGTGTLYAFDTANDTYDASACGSVTNNGTVDIIRDVYAPNGNRYVAITEETTTMHRLDMKLTAVSLRTSTAGIYYESTYNCDAVLASKVLVYGSVLSIDNMPGDDFLTEEDDINPYTVIEKPFQNGITTNSAIVNYILKKDREADINDEYSRITIYANPYIGLDLDEGDLLLVGDTQNAGKKITDEDFTGVAFSLLDVMNILDADYNSYDANILQLLENFYSKWIQYGVTWEFNNIGKKYGGKLTLVDGLGYCMVCQKNVQWTALDQETYATTAYGTAADGAHLYLAEDITCTSTEGSGFLMASATAGQTVCFHLNGHSLTTTKIRALYGNTGVLNVLGSGTVAGCLSSANYGATVQINTSNSKGVVNLYSGTYRQYEKAGTGTYVAAIRSTGGAINVYEEAHIDGSVTGNAIWTGTASSTNSILGLYNTVVDGKVYISGSASKTSKLTLDNAKVNGTVDVNGVSTVVLQGAPVVTLLDMEKASLATLVSMHDGASISVSASGCFTEENTKTADYSRYFKAANSGEKIVVLNNTLLCQKDYSTKLELDQDQKGYCLVCKKTVQWEALTNSNVQVRFTNGQHLYLEESLTYEGEDFFVLAPETQGQKGCLHLNGYNITATNSGAIYSGGGILNVLGGGTVIGYAGSTDQGAAVSVNSDVANAAINLYGGVYKKYAGSADSAGAVACGSAGGTLNLYGDATIDCEESCAVYMGACEKANAVLNVDGATVYGAIVLNTPVGAYESLTTVDSANIFGTLQVAQGTDVTLTGRPKIDNLAVDSGVLVTLKSLLRGTDVAVSADGIFTEANTYAQTWAAYFTGKASTDWVVVQKQALCCLEKTTLPNGKNVLVVGNSMTYYSKYVIDKGHVLPTTTRVNDKGYLYQVFKANGVDVNITNFTFGAHTFKDFYSGKCAANRGHNGYNHLPDLAGQSYDYVIFQEGNEAADNENILAELQPLMDFFLEQNPSTEFLFLVHSTVHTDSTAWRASIKELDQHGVTVVDWGAIVYDLINGNTVVPDSTQTYNKFSFIVNKSASDGKHPNILAGYIAAQMTYCAITGESAVGKDYSFWNDVKANSAFNLTSYKNTYYAYDKTVPSNTNFEAVFSSAAEMTGLQKLIDKYLAEKSYMDY